MSWHDCRQNSRIYMHACILSSSIKWHALPPPPPPQKIQWGICVCVAQQSSMPRSRIETYMVMDHQYQDKTCILPYSSYPSKFIKTRLIFPFSFFVRFLSLLLTAILQLSDQTATFMYDSPDPPPTYHSLLARIDVVIQTTVHPSTAKPATPPFQPASNRHV